MIEDKLAHELRTIQTLLVIDKKEELHEIFGDLDKVEKAILNKFSSTEWRGTGEFKSELAEEQNTSVRTVDRRIDSLLDRNLVEKKGNSSGTEYRLTGLYDAGQLVLEE
jgi:DNA-binding MarR family transcriptional regulator